VDARPLADLGTLGDGATPAVAVLGTGRMGAALAGALTRQGFDVTVWDRDAARAAHVASTVGASTESTAARAARHADVVLVAVTDAGAARDLLLSRPADGTDAVAPQLRADAVVVLVTTCSPRAARALHGDLADLGLRMVEAPVVGTPRAAAGGALTTLAGGDPATVDLVAPVLRAWTTPGRVLVTGPVGSASAVKLTAVVATAAALEGVGEALRLGQDQGLDRDLVLDALGGGPLAGLVASRDGALRDRDAAPDPEYRVDMFLAEVSLALYESGSALPAAEAAFLQARLAASGGRADHDATEVVLRREAAAVREAVVVPSPPAAPDPQPAG
jgi:3-hydroxyisobutyrate dehydrogenase